MLWKCICFILSLPKPRISSVKTPGSLSIKHQSPLSAILKVSSLFFARLLPPEYIKNDLKNGGENKIGNNRKENFLSRHAIENLSFPFISSKFFYTCGRQKMASFGNAVPPPSQPADTNAAFADALKRAKEVRQIFRPTFDKGF